MNELVNDNAVCSTAVATLGLLNNLFYSWKPHPYQFGFGVNVKKLDDHSRFLVLFSQKIQTKRDDFKLHNMQLKFACLTQLKPKCFDIYLDLSKKINCVKKGKYIALIN